MKFFLPRKDLSKTVWVPFPNIPVVPDLKDVHANDRLPKGVGYAIVEILTLDGRIIYRIGKQKRFLFWYYWSWLKRVKYCSMGYQVETRWESGNLDSALAYIKKMEEDRQTILRNIANYNDSKPKVVYPYFKM